MTDELTTTDATEAADLESLESVVAQWLVSYEPAGLALRTIRDERLYRDTHKSFESYCKERWNYGKAYAHRMIASAEVAENIRMSPIGDILPPERESHARELSRLHDKDEQVRAWQATLIIVGGDRKLVEAKHVRAEVAKFLPEKTDPPFDFVRERDEMFGWLIGRLEKWPDEYRDTFAAFVTNIAQDIQEQQRAD